MDFRKLADKLTGNVKTDDAIEPSASPLDFIPYERIPAIAQAGKVVTKEMLEQMAKSNALKKVLGDNIDLGGQVFNPTRAAHVDAIKPHLDELIPNRVEEHYYDSDIVHDLLKNGSDEVKQNIMSIPEVKQAIRNSGMKVPGEE